MTHRTLLLVTVAAFVLTNVGCASTSESASQDTLTANVGQYPPGPSGVAKPRVGVPPFSVANHRAMDGLAADQMTTLLDLSGRFDVIERAQLEQLLKEQKLEGIVKPGELAKSGQVRGIDYLLLGKVTNLRIKKEETRKGTNVAGIGGIFNTHGFSSDAKDVRIKTDCGVDIRLVDPTTGQIKVANFSEYVKTDAASSLGISILGASASSDADIEISEDDKGKILRLALDDALRRSLPKIDSFLRQAPAAVATPAANVTAPAVAPAAGEVAKKFCPQCGKETAPAAKFCGGCGAKLN
jgi:curli biogenesis system outer membrane secretion channel CsgG